ncbi:MAG: YlcI/YnfO family protein [Candidatus Latescibacterota bacterium]
MATMSVRLPESLHRKARELAEREGVSLNQLVSTALAEKLAALLTVKYLEERARRGSRQRFEAVLSRVPDGGPDPDDRE